MRGVDARGASERGHFQSGVVGHCREAGGSTQGCSLEPSIAEQRAGILDDIGHMIRPWEQIDHAGEESLDLDHLVGIRRRTDELHHRPDLNVPGEPTARSR